MSSPNEVSSPGEAGAGPRARPAPGAGGWVEVAAPAKVNLWLEVHGRRADGYHELTSVVMALDLCDRVRARRRAEPGVSLALEGAFASPDVPAGPANLAFAAAEAGLGRVRELVPGQSPDPEPGRAPAAGEPGDRGDMGDMGGLELVLDKRIPSQSGLGGASSDAAAALAALEAVFDLDLGAAWRGVCLAAKGADCVFFERARESGVAICEGRGEVVTPLDVEPPGWWVALVVPELACPTVEVYRALEFPLFRPPSLSTFRTDLFARTAERARGRLFNQLESAASKAFPEIARWRGSLDAAGAHHYTLCGSGSGFFGLHDGRGEARAALDDIEHEARRAGLALRGTWVTRPFCH